MPRRLKLVTVEVGKLELFLIYSSNSVWEPEWRPMQGHPIASLFTMTSKEVVDHALRGWTAPLTKALGIPPLGALRKLPVAAKGCMDRQKCPHYDQKDCNPAAKDMPWCFVPGGITDEVRQLASDVIQMWREGVYILLVEEPNG